MNLTFQPMLFPLMPYDRDVREVCMGRLPLKALLKMKKKNIKVKSLGHRRVAVHPDSVEPDPLARLTPADFWALQQARDPGTDMGRAVEAMMTSREDYRSCVLAAGHMLARYSRPNTQCALEWHPPVVALPSPAVFSYEEPNIPAPKAAQPVAPAAAAAAVATPAAPTQGLRQSCLKCARKHIAQSIVLLNESLLGYPDHRWLATGHLAEAAEETVMQYPKLAAMLRFDRKMVEDGKGMPDLMRYFRHIQTVEDNGAE